MNKLAPTWKQRCIDAWHYVLYILKKIWPYVVIGIAIGGIMHGWAPSGLLAKYATRSNPFAVFVAVLIGIPLYSNAAGTIPIVKELTRLGMPIGSILESLVYRCFFTWNTNLNSYLMCVIKGFYSISKFFVKTKL